MDKYENKLANNEELLNLIFNELNHKYYIYKNSVIEKDNTLFFLLKNKNSKFICEVSKNDNFILKMFLENTVKINFGNEGIYKVGIFNTTKDNIKNLIRFFDYLTPKKINKNVSVGFGDRIGLASGIHSSISKNYDFFPIFAQQSIREITKTQRKSEDVLFNSVIGIIQSGFKENWGADADHIRDVAGLKTLLNNDFLPYSMFTIDTFDFMDTDESELNYAGDNNLKKRLKKAEKYIGKTIKFHGYNVIYSEDNIHKIVKRYYKSLDFLLECYKIIKCKTKNFNFEPTFDEKDIDTTPEDHFYIVNELFNDGVEFTTFAPKFPGIFEKGIDYIGDINYFISQLEIHKKIVDYFGNYKLSLHSADDKFSIFKPFKNVFGNNFHIKTSGTTWMESLRTVAEYNPDLFKLILNITFEKAQENSKAYYIKLDYPKINKLLKSKNITDLIDIKETRQLLHVSYGSILKKFRDEIIKVLMANEEAYEKNVMENYKRHFDAIFN